MGTYGDAHGIEKAHKEAHADGLTPVSLFGEKYRRLHRERVKTGDCVDGADRGYSLENLDQRHLMREDNDCED